MPGTRYIQMAIMDRFDRAMDYGIYNCRALTTDASTPSIHSDGRAGDSGFPDAVTGERYVTNPHPQGFQLAELLRAQAADLGIMGIIWNRRRYDWRTPYGREYTGPSPHIDHVHWEQHPDLAVSLPMATAYRLIGDPPMAFTPEQETWLKRLATHAEFLSGFAVEMGKPGPTTGMMATPQSLVHLLEVHRLVAKDAGVGGTEHEKIKAHLLGQ